MKLQSQNYISPILTEGTFVNVFIEDGKKEIIDNSLYYIEFLMYCVKDNVKVILDRCTLPFQGNNNDSEESPTTNRTAYAKEIATGEIVPLLAVLAANNMQLPATHVIEDIGYPNREDSLLYFDGGSIDDCNISLTNPLAQLFIKDAVVMKGEKIGVQFEFVE